MNNTDNPVHWIGCTFKLYDDKTMIYSNHIEFGSKTYKNMEIPAHGTQYTPWISQTVPISESYTYYPDNLEYYTINE